MEKLGLIFTFLFLYLVLSESTAQSIPVFARKYETSCQTCHAVFPKLTPFGEAFRRNGLRFPEGADADYSKDKAVKMGVEGYKKVFPGAVWPSELPGLPPVSIHVESEIKNMPEGTVKTSLDDIAAHAEIMTGGTFDEHFSFIGEIEFMGHEAEIERLYTFFRPYTQPTLNLKVGKFEPNVFSFSHFRRLGPTYWITTKTVGDNKWSLETTQRGIEINGVPGGRMGYNVGLVEGRKNTLNEAKDMYAHIDFKMGGMRLDGVEEGESKALTEPAPWRETSTTLGVFGYSGQATLTATREDSFTMLGADANMILGDLNLIAAYAVENHSSPTIDSPGTKLTANHLMLEGTYVLFPWLVPVLRYESFTKDSSSSQRVVFAPQVLVRANSKLVFQVELENSGAGFKNTENAIVLSTAF